MTWAACTPASPTPGATVTCTGTPPPLNGFSSAVDALTVNVDAAAVLNSTAGTIVLNLTGNDITLNNSGVIEASSVAIGPIAILGSGVLIGNANASTVNITNLNTGSIIGARGDAPGATFTSLAGLALNVQNSGTTNITNNGSLSTTPLFAIPPNAADALLVAIYGGGQVNFTNATASSLTGRIAFESSAGNSFKNAGTITGSVSMGANSNNTFTAVTGSSISNGGGTAPAISGSGSVPPITFAATGTVDGGAGGINTLILQNPVGPGGGTSGAGVALSTVYTNFTDLRIDSGTWTLQGALLVSNSSTLNGGVALFNNNTTFGTGTLTSNGGTIQASSAGLSVANPVLLQTGGLSIQGTNNMSLTGDISGSGGLIKNTSGSLTLNGNNSYLGNTALNGGTLIVGNNIALGSGSLNTANGTSLSSTAAITLGNALNLTGNLTIPGTQDMTLTGNINGNGGLIKNGPQSLTLNGNNGYLGNTALNSGTLIVGNNNALGLGSLNPATGTSLSSTTAITLGNSINLAGNLTISGSQDLTLTGVINGAGGITKNDTGTLIFNNNNNYLGSTVINGGSILVGSDSAHASAAIVNVQVNAGGTLGGYGTVRNNVSIAANGHLAPGNGIGMLSVGGDLNLAQNSILDFEFTSAGMGDNVNVTGNLNINGSILNVIDIGGFSPGVYNLFTYGGTLSETNGGITLGATPGGTYVIQNLTADKKINLINSTGLTLNFWNANGLASPTQRGGGSGIWSSTSMVWTDANGTVTTAMQPQPGFAIFGGAPGTVNIDNSSGQTSALGMQFEVNGYQLDGDPLELNNGSNPAIIRVSNSSANTAIINSILIGSSGIDKQDVGILVLTNANAYTGTTFLSGGILSVSTDNNLGVTSNSLDFKGGTLETTANITMNRTTTLEAAGGTFLTDTGTTLTQNGAINGPGALNKIGSGTLILNNAADSYAGGTTVNGGTLQAGVAGALVNNTAYTVNAGTLDLNNFNLIMSSLSGNGGAINAGNATLTDNQAINTSYAGSLSGSNLFVKEGAGNLILTGDSSTFSGTSQINAGTLQVNGTLGGNLLVNAGGRLEGVGTVGNTTVFGTIAPGTGGLQTLNVAGNYVQNAGSIYDAQINLAGQSSRIQISGTANLNGGTVKVTAENGLYTFGHYTLLNALNGVTGTYNNLTQNLPFIHFGLQYDANNVFLDVEQSNITFADAAATPNERGVANAVESLGAGNLLFDKILNLPTIQSARDAFNSLSGEVYAATIGSLMEASRYVEDAMLNRMTTTTLETDKIHKARNVWVEGVGSWGHRNGNSNTARAVTSSSGVFIGADANTNAGHLGFLAGYSTLQTKLDARLSNANSDNYHLGLYADHQLGNLNLRMGGAYSWHDLDARRAVVFPGLSEYLTTDYEAHTAQGFIESGYALKHGNWLGEPFARASAINVNASSFHEQGGIAALHSQNDHETIYFSTLGARIYNTVKQEENFVLSTRGLLGWRHAFNNINPLARMAFDTSIPFTIAGSPIARNGLVIDAGVDTLLPKKALTLTLSYTGQVAGRVQDHGIRGVISWRFS